MRTLLLLVMLLAAPLRANAGEGCAPLELRSGVRQHCVVEDHETAPRGVRDEMYHRRIESYVVPPPGVIMELGHGSPRMRTVDQLGPERHITRER